MVKNNSQLHGEPLLSIQNLTMGFHNKVLLENVSLSLNSGEVLAVLGANGAGKSTLLNYIIDGDSQYQKAGSAHFLGQPILSMTPELRAKRIALLPQASRLQFPFTVEEVVSLGRTPHSTGKESDQKIIHSMLDRLDIMHLRAQIYTTLSGGEKQRVNLARVLTQLAAPPQSTTADPFPRLLLLDEPCNALDMQHQQQLLAIIKEICDDNVAVIIVAHDLNWVVQCADYFVALKQGHIVTQGDAGTVITPSCLQAVYNINTTIVQHPKHKTPVVLSE